MSIMHNGEKVLNNINTVPITQTIDASSTEKEIPSAKAVNTLLNNKVNKMAMLTSQNIDDLVNEGSYYVIAATNAPDAYGWVDVLANNDYTIQLFYPSITTNCEMYIRRRREGVWGKWKRVCTTSVADVAQTDFSSEESTITGTMTYTVKDGICYVVLWGVSGTKTGFDFVTYSSMPKCHMTVGIPFCSASSDGGNIAFAYINTNQTVLKINIFKTGIQFFGSFSYPVAES